MRVRKWWPARLGLVAFCLIWTGCGGSDVPDPESDSHAATAEAAPPVASAPAPASVAENAVEPAAAPAEATSKAAPAPAESPSPQPKSEEPAANDTQLALADPSKPAEPNSGSPASTSLETSSNSDAPETATRGGSSRIPADPATLARESASTSSHPPVNSGSTTPPVGSGSVNPNPSAPPPVPNFRTPVGAVTAFLNALKVKDPERLAEATALRAPTEAKPRNRDLFSAILEKSLTEEDLNELAIKLDGFQIVDFNPPHSSARLGVILMKPSRNGSQLIRTITARHEKAGWKVVDISGQGELEKPILIPRGFGTGHSDGRR